MNAPAKVDVLAAFDMCIECFGATEECPDDTACIEEIKEARAAAAGLIEREAKLRAALTLAVEKADRIGGDMKYSDFAHPGHPNGECAWYLAAKLALVTGEGS